MAAEKNNKTLNVPILRFPEFSGEWEKCTIGDLGNVITGNTPPTADEENYVNGTRLWASPADLGATKYIVSTQTLLSNKGFEKTRSFPANSILVTCIGSTIGKMGMSKTEMASNQQINTIVPVQHDANFVYYAIQSRFPRYLSSIAVQAVPILSKSSFEKLTNYTTSEEEQIKIGNFLSLIDERIDIQKKIIEKYESLIRGLREKLTRQGDANKSINECLECHSSTLQESEVLDTGRYPVYGAIGVCGYTDTPDVSGEGILIIKDGASVGVTYFADGCYSSIGTLNRLTAKQGINLRYVYYCLKVMNFAPYKTGLAIPHIYFKDYGKHKIWCPSFEQQSRIADALINIDNKIHVEKLLLEQLNSQKRYMLNQLFI